MPDLESATAASPCPPRITIHALRTLILAVLAVSVLGFTGGVFALVQRIFDNFGPAIERDLQWKTARGAQELARTTDLGLALGDQKLVTEAFGDYRQVEDVVAIVAVDAGGRVTGTQGTAPEQTAVLFSGPAATVRTTPGYLVAWAAAVVEGNAVGKVAVVMSTRRLMESKRLLRRISVAMAVAGLITLLCGFLFVNFFTRTIAQRDTRLAAYAASLESKVAERTADLDRINVGMRLVLDNVEQGFLAITLDGVMLPERSSVLNRWFGAAAPGMTLTEYISAVDRNTADWLALGLEEVAAGVMPRDLTLDQLPKSLAHQGRTFKVTYVPIVMTAGAAEERLLVVITDRTDEIARDKVEQENRGMLGLFHRILADRAGAEQFLEEASNLVRELVAGSTRQLDERRLHTLKGNCGLFGIESIAHMCNELETVLSERSGTLLASERETLRAQWAQVSSTARGMLGDRRSAIELNQADLKELNEVLKARVPHEQIAALAESWRDELVSVRLSRLAERAEFLAKRLGKATLHVEIDAAGLRLPAERWTPFWAAVVHPINNALDHGIETAEVRLAMGKPAGGRLRLGGRWEGDELVLSISDDGRGIDWATLATHAASKGLPHATRMDLVDAMLSDGISTKSEVTATSGRGVGLAALREVTWSLGGRIEVESEAGRGTTLRCRFPGINPQAFRSAEHVISLPV